MAISPAVEVRTPSRVRMILVLGVMVALGPLTIDMYLPALPKIADDLAVSSSVIQLTLTGTLAGLALVALSILLVQPVGDINREPQPVEREHQRPEDGVRDVSPLCNGVAQVAVQHLHHTQQSVIP